MIDAKKIDELLSQVRKPGRYIGDEWNAVKKDLGKVSTKVALVFPDLYEIGMSHLGFKLIYHLLNEKEDIACERVFSPDVDLEGLLRKERLPIFSLESKEPVSNFDMIGFCLAYELTYTNVLNILDLAGIPLKSKDRDENFPLIIAGGPSTFNPEPMSDFIDLFVIGEAEEVVFEIIEEIKNQRSRPDYTKKRLLRNLSKIKGVYIPAFYQANYNKDGTLDSLKPLHGEIPSIITKRSIDNLDKSFYPTKQIVPYINIVHDRVSVEIMRGCPNLCRFCQARALYHTKRERSLEEIVRLAEESLAETGYEEVSLLSLSSGNHSQIIPIITSLIDRFQKRGISVSLPSLRIDKVLKEFPSLLSRIKKSGLTFALEAGSKRLRSAMNKSIDMEELKPAIEAACNSGWNRVKLYFMIGLPTESYEDIDGIVDTIHTILSNTAKRVHINVSINSFIPKPHTPFQWEDMEREEGLNKKMRYIRENLRNRRVKLKFHDTKLSILEGVFSRGGRRLGSVILQAYKKGCRFDSWTEHFNFSVWMNAFKEEGIDPHFYLHKRRDFQEKLPWEHIDCGISKDYLIKEAKKAEIGCKPQAASYKFEDLKPVA